jgi:AcrR family transcriptional regulator
MEVMQMNKSSIYAAYGSKEALFQKAVERYVQGPAAFLAAALSQPTARQVIERILTQAATMLAETHHPAGCLVTQGALACGTEAQAIKTLLNGYRMTMEQKLGERFAIAVQAGEIAASVEVGLLAKLVMTVHQGMTIQAVHGASQEALASIASTMSRLLTQDFMPT